MRPRSEESPSATEDRLRAAFAARAALVTYRDLRPGVPPEGRDRGLRRVRGLAFAALGGAAAAAAAYLFVLAPGGPAEPVPVPPARSPDVSRPVTAPTPHPAAPSVAHPEPATPGDLGRP
ncbi:hypothetical protein [Streptomyces sp. NPDC058326]|uniref:hypothetical protein n=1 Tax=Streptomyces sp. NPDC058326 TaxID=3346447 RepID=UPI0036F0B905